MSERKNIKRNNMRVTRDQFIKTGRKGNTVGSNKLRFPEDRYLQKLVSLGLL